MDEALLKLTAWLSPAFPVGGFAYSHGLETAIADGIVTDAGTLTNWLSGVLAHGSGRTDAILLIHAHAATVADDSGAFQDVAALADALSPSGERRRETILLGTAFAETIGSSWGGDAAAAPYPIAVGRAAAEAGAEAGAAARLYLQAFAASLISAAIRLVPLGQVDGQRVLAALHPLIMDIAAEAEDASLDQIGSAAISADISSMRHEVQAVRLFRS
ncbi:MAG: urease accessory protein UreF [Pseudomonadota bacterium]